MGEGSFVGSGSGSGSGGGCGGCSWQQLAAAMLWLGWMVRGENMIYKLSISPFQL